MPSRALIEAAVITAVEAVLSGKSVEDERIECKSDLMPPNRVRQLAGAANAARGEDIIWIVGIDETAKRLVPVGQSIDLADWWAQVESNFDDGIAPDLVHIWVPVTGGRVLALHFATDRAPYVVKSSQGGSPELEVPWRAGTRTRSAKRHELLKILLPTISVPDAALLACTGTLSEMAENRIGFRGQANLYVEHIQSGAVVMPTHQMKGVLNIWGTDYSINVRPVINVNAIDSGGMETLRDGIYCHRPGLVRLELVGDVGPTLPDTPDKLRDLETATLKLEIGVVGGRRPIRVDTVLRSKFDRRLGPTMNVELDMYTATGGQEQ
jgi:hypothetical protein